MASIRKRSGYTYFIQRGEDGPIKIGKSTDPSGRLRTLQTGNDQPLRILLVLKGSHREAKIHRMFAAHRLEGEWFSPVSEILEYIEMMSESDGLPEDRREDEPSPKRQGTTGPHWDFSDKSFEETLAEIQAIDRVLIGFLAGFPKSPEEQIAFARSICRQDPEPLPD